MRIDSSLIIGRIQPMRPKNVGAVAGAPAGVDSLEFSSRVEDLRSALDALKGVPPVREEKVSELRQQIEEGRFDTNLAALADKLLGTRQ